MTDTIDKKQLKRLEDALKSPTLQNAIKRHHDQLKSQFDKMKATGLKP